MRESLNARTKYRFTLRTLLLVVVVFGTLAGWLGCELRNARQERMAYRELCHLGAVGDDWVGWREILLGREYAPIVQISLPPDVTIDSALPYLTQLDNLRALDLTGHPISDNEIAQLKTLSWIKSLNLSNTKITDSGADHLAKFQHLRWLYVGGTKITDDGIRNLQRKLPHCRID